MTALSLRRWAYRLATTLAVGYAAYVVALKLMRGVTGGPLGEVGEFLLVLAAVTAFAVGLFADESSRQPAAGKEAAAPSSPHS